MAEYWNIPNQSVGHASERIAGGPEVKLANEALAAAHRVDAEELEGDFTPVDTCVRVIPTVVLDKNTNNLKCIPVQ